MNPRLRQLVGSFARHELDGLLVADDTNIRYLTQFPASESWLFVSRRRAFYVTDFRYVLEARKGLRGITVLRYAKSRGETLFEAVRSAGIRRIGFDPNHLTVAQYTALRKRCPSAARLIPAPGLVENLREVKDKGEIAHIRRALVLHKEAYALVRRTIRPHLSEQQIFWRLEEFVRARGVKFSFSPIIASGPNSCYPHAKVTQRKLRKNDLVLVDIGIDVNGYKSDLTRIFFLGKIPSFVRQVHECVAVAQRRAIEKIRPGVAVAELDGTARNYLAKNGLAKYFGHALGHGVGLDIHESPRLAKANPAVLKEGMVITIEPAVYIPNRFGIRIEDMVLVTPQGCEVLSDDIHQ
ncbi:MAG: aminopeptidase P family protein [Candidatus Omnitrophica bacterium]|nr:aminopeptidase P family protein [Candidatus Omnitrophota bacterium]